MVHTHLFEEIRLETREKSIMGMLCWYPLSPYTHENKMQKKCAIFLQKSHLYRGFIEKNDMEVSKCKGVAHINIYIYI